MLDIIFLIPELFFLFCFFLVILYKGLLYYKLKLSVVMNGMFLLGYGGVLYTLLLISGSGVNVSIMSFHMCIDAVVFFVKIIAVVLFLFILWLFHIYFYYDKIGSPEPVLLLSLFFWSSVVCVMSNDFFFFYLLMEFMTIVSYLLAGTHKYSMIAAEASLKYFILGAMSSGFILLGFILLYGFTGLTCFLDFQFLFNLGADLTHIGFGLLVSFLMILAGFLFKLSVVPFHLWVPDVYDGVLPPVVLLFSTLSKIVFITIFCKVLWNVFFELAWLWEFILFFCGLLSIILGSIGGLLQNSVVRLYAYSTIVNGGFFCCFLSLGTLDGLVYLYNYLCIYILTSMALFAVLTFFLIQKEGYVHGFVYLNELAIFAQISGLAALLFILVFFSYAGIPPLSGFLGKFFLFYNFYIKSGFLFGFLVILFTTVVSSVYYVRCIYLMFFFQEKPRFFFKKGGFSWNLVLISFLFLFFLFLFFQPSLVMFLQSIFYSIWL